MIAAINNNKDWQSANTSVHFNEENEVSVVRLHGNKIAEVGDDFVQIFDGGWQTNTTKSRLNVIVNEFCNAPDGVFRRTFSGTFVTTMWSVISTTVTFCLIHHAKRL